ncbi:MAG: hypothetical protein QME74_04310 [Candidatus Edwardsbacteria bacterium]|nr:hypothetical protein [Candidatus Edwardsbacteria bacterium]
MDTSVQTARVRYAILRRAGFAGRFHMSLDASDGLRATVEAGVRRRHPEYDGETTRLAVLRLTVGERLFRRCFPKATARG